MIPGMSTGQDSAEAVLLLSGGLDSATVLALLQRGGRGVTTLFVNYGQLAAARERQASRQLAEHFAVRWDELTLTGLPNTTVGEVRGRNDLLLALAAAFSPAPFVGIGVHSGTPYADCSPLHQRAWQAVLDVQHGGGRRILAPLRYLSKAQVIALALELKVPAEDTYSCEDADGPCGRCLSCQDRERLDARA